MKTYPESRLTDLLIEFDEMGFSPTTVCPNPEQAAIEWKEQVVKEIQKLQTENAELRARLEKAVDLPVNIGGKIWEIFDNTLIFERNVYHIGLSENRTTFRLTGESGLFYLGEVELTDYKKTWFTAREAAEARLKEIKE